MTRATPAKFRDRPRIGELATLASALVVLLAVYFAGAPLWHALRYERVAIAAGQWWRLLTAHLVHEEPRHLALNLAGLIALWSLYVRDARLREWLVVALASALGVGLGLLFFEPDLAWYVGLSGLLHGLWAAGAVAAWRRWPLESAVALALLGAKLAIEYLHGPLLLEADSGLTVISAAHRCGALAGLAAALALRLWRAPL